jgi:MFS family permease
MSAFGHARELTSPRSRIEASLLDARMALVSACLGWMFDAMDLQIFTLIQFPSVSELIGSVEPAAVAYTGGVIFAWKLAAWGLGGIAFGIVADRIGRARTIIVTVLIYCAFTGLSSLTQIWWQLAILQALVGAGGRRRTGGDHTVHPSLRARARTLDRGSPRRGVTRRGRV